MSSRFGAAPRRHPAFNKAPAPTAAPERPALDLDALDGMSVEQLCTVCTAQRLTDRATIRTLVLERGLPYAAARAAFEAWQARQPENQDEDDNAGT